MKLVKGLLLAVGFLSIAGFSGWQFWGKSQVGFIGVATAYSAKQICSCRFVAGREMNSCLHDFTNDISQLTVVEREFQIISTAPLGLGHSTARYSPGTGCSLTR